MSETLTIPFQVTDGDHAAAKVTTAAVSGNTDAILTKSLKITGEGAQRKLIVTAMVAKGTSTIKVTATDPLGATAVLSIKVRVVMKEEVRIDGWALVMKIRGSDGSETKNKNDCEKYAYDSDVWQSAGQDGDENDFTLAKANRKLPDYNKVKFKTIRVCSIQKGAQLDPKKGGDECFAYTFEKEWANVRAMFTICNNGDNYKHDGINCRDQSNGRLKEGMDRVFSITGMRNCGLQRPGFSQKGNDNARTRWGWLSNLPEQGCQPSDSQDSDAAIGIGLHAQSSQCACGAGNTPWYNSGQNVKGCNFCKDAWVWVKIA